MDYCESMRIPSWPSNSVETNRGPASPLNVGSQFWGVLHAPPSYSAGVAHLDRSA